jgi:large subunit ribosomal protein L7e
MVGEEKNSKSTLPLVPESVLKKRHDLDDLARKRAALEAIEPARAKGKRRGKKNAVYVIKPETILAHSRNKRNHKARYLRVQKKGMQKRASNHSIHAVKQIPLSDNDDVDETTGTSGVQEVSYVANSVGSKMVFVIRIRDSVATPMEVTKVLTHHLGLKKKHEGVFLRYNAETRAWLHCVEPWVVYGPVPSSMILDLIVRRGHARIQSTGERVPLSDNTIIEQELGAEHNVLCVEDLVHELSTVGPAFDVIAQSFLWPFQLADAKTDLERRTLRKKDTKLEYGDRGEAIQEYLQQVL